MSSEEFLDWSAAAIIEGDVAIRQSREVVAAARDARDASTRARERATALRKVQCLALGVTRANE